MIETLEKFQRIMRSTHNTVVGSIDLEATFAALCEVVRTARFAKFMSANSLDVALNDELRKLSEALDALPKWLLEGEGDKKDPGYFFSGPTDSQGIPISKPDAESEEGRTELGEMADELLDLATKALDSGFGELSTSLTEHSVRVLILSELCEIRKLLQHRTRGEMTTEVETTCCKPGSHVFLWTSQEKPNGELPEDTRCDCGRYFVGVSDAEKVDLS